MKGYHDIVGDGGSRVLEQVTEQRARITEGLAGVRHLVAVGSGKGGVGKSTLTLNLAGAASGHQTFVAGVGDGAQCIYCIPPLRIRLSGVLCQKRCCTASPNRRLVSPAR